MALPIRTNDQLHNLEAVQLWLQGREAWNAWVAAHPAANVDFSRVDFGCLRPHCIDRVIDFGGFHFPAGRISFIECRFGDGPVRFKKALFNSSDLDFSLASFGEGRKDFVRAVFGKGRYCFRGVDFGDGIVDFAYAEFAGGSLVLDGAGCGDGSLCFDHCQFKGVVSLDQLTIGAGSVGFAHAAFARGVSLAGAHLSKGGVSLRGAQFGGGDVRLSGSCCAGGRFDCRELSLGEGNLIFIDGHLTDCETLMHGANAGEGQLVFDATLFGGKAVFNFADLAPGRVSFEDCEFQGPVRLSPAPGSSWRKSFSFRGAHFHDTLDITDVDFVGVPDLNLTRTTHHVGLQGIGFELERQGPCRQIVSDPEDIARLRRLKELAEINRDHELALQCHADEMRAKRWTTTRVAGSLLDLLFSALCSYGQLITRPLLLLVLSSQLFAVGYGVLSTKLSPWHHFFELWVFSLANAVGVLPVARQVRQWGLAAFYREGDSLTAVYGLMVSQGVISLILVFLVALGLRNRFRI